MKSTAGLLFVACAAAVQAQEQVSYYFQLSDTELSPGESLTISAHAVLEPGIGAKAVWNTKPGNGEEGEVLCFGVTGLGIDMNGTEGTWSKFDWNNDLHLYDPLPYWTATTYRRVWIGQNALSGFYVQADDNWLFDITWTPDTYTPGVVHITQIDEWPGFTSVILKIPSLGGKFVGDLWTNVLAQTTIKIVPAPSGLALFGGGAFMVLHWRRRT